MTYVYLTLDRTGRRPYFDAHTHESIKPHIGRLGGDANARAVWCRPHRVDHWKRRLLDDARAILDAEQERLRVAYEQVDDLRMETCGTI